MPSCPTFPKSVGFVVEDYEEKELGELEADEYIEGIEEEQGDIRLPVELFRKMTSSSKNSKWISSQNLRRVFFKKKKLVMSQMKTKEMCGCLMLHWLFCIPVLLELLLTPV